MFRHRELLIPQPEDANTEHGGHRVEVTRQCQQRLSSIFGPVIPQRGLDFQCGAEIWMFFFDVSRVTMAFQPRASSEDRPSGDFGRHFLQLF